MESQEIKNIIAAFIVVAIVCGFSFVLDSNWIQFGYACIYSAIILIVAVGSKKLMALWLDADVEHEIWKFSRYGFKSHWHLKKPIPGGVIFPLFLLLFSAFFSLGYLFIKFLAVLSFETKPSRYRAAKRFGFYSFTEMTDWHNALIGAAGTISLFILIIIAYFTNLELLAKFASYYVFCNMLPLTKFDGNQIFFGSRILYSILAVITLIFFAYALFL